MKIIRFSYESLRNEAHVAYHDSVNSLFGIYPPDLLGIVPQYDPYKPAYDTEVSVLDIVRRSGLTAEIGEQDAVRDSLFRGLADAVKSAVKHFDPAKREAAAKVQNILTAYGNIAARTLDQETAAIDDLVRELQTPANNPLVATLSLDDWVEQLQAENDRFKALMQERYSERAQQPAVQMKAARKDTDAAFRAILDQLDALALVNGAADYDPFIAELNAVSERYKNILAQEKGQRKKKNETQSPE